MRTLIPGLALLLAIGFFLPQAQAQADSFSYAKAFFSKWEKLGNAYDASVCNLYSDKAIIQNIRQYPTGQRKTMRMTNERSCARLIVIMLLILHNTLWESLHFRLIQFVEESTEIQSN